MGPNQTGQAVDLLLSIAGVAVLGGFLLHPKGGGGPRAASGYRPAQWRQLSPLHLLAVAVGYVVAAAAFNQVFLLGESDHQAGGFFNAALADAAGKVVALVMMLLIVKAIYPAGLRDWLGMRGRFGRQLVRALACRVAIYPLVNGLVLSLSVYVIHGVLGWQAELQHPTVSELLSGRLQWWQAACIVFMAVVLAPVTEELFFRGMLQNYLAGRLRSPAGAIVICGLLFGLIHLPLLSMVVPLAVLGIIIGWWYWRTDSLLQAVLVHALFNATTVILLYLGFVG